MSITLTVSGTGDSPLRRFHWDEVAAAWAGEVAPLAQEAVKALAPVGKGPGAGTLRDSVSVREEAGAGQMLITLYSTVPYARYVTGGTRPHVITAGARTRGGWTGPYTGQPGPGSHTLHWVDGSGSDRFARSVKHPGTKPNPFPERAIGPLRPLLMERFARAAQEAMEL